MRTTLNCNYSGTDDVLSIALQDARVATTSIAGDTLTLSYDEAGRIVGLRITDFTFFIDYLTLRDAVGGGLFNLAVELQRAWANGSATAQADVRERDLVSA